MRDSHQLAQTKLVNLLQIVQSFDARSADQQDWLRVRAKVGVAYERFEEAWNDAGSEVLPSSGRARILAYLQLNVGMPVAGAELRGVAGIDDWARRIRELRVEMGYDLISGVGRDDMDVSEYVLNSVDPDEQQADDWGTAKRVRNLGTSIEDRLLEYLKAMYPRSADKERLTYVAKSAPSWPRRMRELVEAGWRISSSNTDPSLAPGEYRLDSLEQAEGRTREAMKLRMEILERDDFLCTKDGRSPKQDGVRLEVHHVDWHSRGGSNEPSNLVTLCSSCHAGVHAISEGSTKDELENPGVEGSYSEN